MTADRFGAIPAGEYTALASLRDGMSGHAAQQPWTEPTTAARPEPVAAAPSRSAEPVWRPVIPPQHGAWAFLIVPVLCGFAVAGASAAGWLFLAAWVCAYPVGYYLGRGLTARARRGSWTRLARRERTRALPWAVLTAALGLPLVLTRPWLLAAAAILAVLWGGGLVIAARQGERSLANDLMLVAQAAVALPLAVAVVVGPASLTGDLAGSVLEATVIVAAYLAGSVLHVKSLLREAGNARFRRANVAWHGALVLGTALASAWWLVAFLPALARAVLLRPGMRPGAIGGVEAVVAVLVVVAALLAL
ncbi:MAG TPA: YwiC-like family protein [Motilibacterales bacterium]|nr:YwiC-like family protein [Motilibacterales bacterium]